MSSKWIVTKNKQKFPPIILTYKYVCNIHIILVTLCSSNSTNFVAFLSSCPIDKKSRPFPTQALGIWDWDVLSGEDLGLIVIVIVKGNGEIRLSEIII